MVNVQITVFIHWGTLQMRTHDNLTHTKELLSHNLHRKHFDNEDVIEIELVYIFNVFL